MDMHYTVTCDMDYLPNFKEIIAHSPIVFTIGVAGDSGSGKTTFTNAIRQIFGPGLVSTKQPLHFRSYQGLRVPRM